jgi:hypothetical protein
LTQTRAWRLLPYWIKREGKRKKDKNGGGEKGDPMGHRNTLSSL